MKKKILYVVLIALCWSCDKDNALTESLADSVSVVGYCMEGEWSFDGTTTELSRENSFLDIRPLTDGSSIELSCGIITLNPIQLEYRITINSISLSGKPGDVTFGPPENTIGFSERFSNNAILEYNPVLGSIDGWIKLDDKPSTRYSPIMMTPQPYDCDIDIECEIDGKPLKVHITRIYRAY